MTGCAIDAKASTAERTYIHRAGVVSVAEDDVGGAGGHTTIVIGFGGADDHVVVAISVYIIHTIN